MIVNARKPISAEPAARPSRPSVTFTALLVLQMTTPEKITQTSQCTSQPGRVERVNEIDVLMPVPAASQNAITVDSPSVIQLFFFQKMPRLCAFFTLM